MHDEGERKQTNLARHVRRGEILSGDGRKDISGLNTRVKNKCDKWEHHLELSARTHTSKVESPRINRGYSLIDDPNKDCQSHKVRRDT